VVSLDHIATTAGRAVELVGISVLIAGAGLAASRSCCDCFEASPFAMAITNCVPIWVGPSS